MKLNQNTTIVGSNIVLVPYKEIHVPRYNDFMQSEELQKLTASEPLTLQSEYEMQKSWFEDEEKCTFILLDKTKLKETNDEVASMIGDTNLYLMENDAKEKVAEAAVMIADPNYRGKHLGWESMLLMLNYGIETLGIKSFIAKISISNTASIRMFEKMHFKEESRSEVFQEVTMIRPVDKNWSDWLRTQLKNSQTLFDLKSVDSL